MLTSTIVHWVIPIVEDTLKLNTKLYVPKFDGALNGDNLDYLVVTWKFISKPS
jgi:hypothetical protein